jgi:hypothetical protein
MPAILVGGFVVLHGLITTMIGISGITSPGRPALQVPDWLGWWPGPFGRSWLFDAANLGSSAAVLGGIVWLVAGLALVAAGLGWIGVPMLRDNWQIVGVAGAAIGLFAAALYFHPFYLVAVLIDIVLVVQLWSQVSTAQ